MNSVTRYSAVNTKIKAIEGKFLKEKDYRAMLESKSIKEVAHFLKEKTHYHETLENVDPDHISRIELEAVLKSNMLNNTDKVISYFNGEYRSFIKALFLRYEIEDLKNIARVIYNGKTIDNIEKYVYIGKFSGIDMDKVKKAKLVREIITATEGTELYKYFLPLLDGNLNENLFRFEMVLDMSYYTILQNKWNKLSKSDMEILKQAQGVVSDLLNIQWIYRGIKYYNLTQEELLNYTINLGFSLNFNDRKKMCYCKNLEELLGVLHEKRYGFLFDTEEIDILLDRKIYRYVEKELRKLQKIYSMSIISVFNFFLLYEYEIKDIISVIEIKGYDMEERNAGEYNPEKYMIKVLGI